MPNSWSRRFAYIYASIFAVPQLAGIHYTLLKISLRGLGILNYYDDKVTGERYFIKQMLPRLMGNKTSLVFFDVGANRGSYSLQLANVFPNAQIYAFEPHPKNYLSLLSLNLEHFYALQKALGDASGIVSLFDYSDRDGSTNASLFQEVISDIHHSTSIKHTVEIDTLDAFSDSYGIDHIDFLKIDTEGNELAVLRGAKTLLEQNHIHVIQFEFNEMNVISRSFLHDFRKLLHGYKLFRLLPKGLLLMPETPLMSELFGFQNIIAVSGQMAHLL